MDHPGNISSLEMESNHRTSEALMRSQTDKKSQAWFPLYSSKTNAIVYLAQKSHKVYLRNSSALLSRSLRLLFKNYLLINHHYYNTSVFIFHTGDFTELEDLAEWETQNCPIGASGCKGTLQLVNLMGSRYWRTPAHLKETDLPLLWRNPKFNLGYRHMIRWYAFLIWDYFYEINQEMETNYRYIMRMDEESFFHSPISYDLFGFMAQHDYFYAYRLCSYEMNAIQKIFHNYTTYARQTIDHQWVKNRHFNGASCGFYNNWFIGALDFFRSDQVQHMLRWFDNEGFMYRDRLNDLVIQTAAVYAFCPSNKIHRFLDWSYEHFTVDSSQSGCPVWGALSTGYLDNASEQLVGDFLKELEKAQCIVDSSSVRRKVPLLHVSLDHVDDLSPTYNHLPLKLRNVSILSVKAGKIDLPGRGEKSG